jgi:hypothetical protein
MKLSLILLLFVCVNPVFTQTIDTITKVKGGPVVEKFPNKRNFEFKYEQFAPGRYSPEFYDQSKGDGRFSNHYRFKGAVTVPVYTGKQWLINTSVRYKYEVFKFEDLVNNAGVISPVIHADKDEHHLFTGALSITRFGSLFKKRMVYNGILLADASEQEWGRVKGTLSATMILKRTKNTSIAVGVIGLIDPSAQIPLLPVVSFQHEFQHAWSVDLFLPQRIYLRKSVFKNARISLGAELENELLYMKLNDKGISDTYDYRQFELKSGITYEHNLGHSIIATFKGGINNYINARGVIKGQSANNDVYKANPAATGYFSLGISFHPFENK